MGASYEKSRASCGVPASEINILNDAISQMAAQSPIVVGGVPAPKGFGVATYRASTL